MISDISIHVPWN